MNDTFSFTLESPLTKEQINLITDAEFEYTDRIFFVTPKGKHVEFVKALQWIPCSERLPDREGEYLVTWGTINVMCVLHYDQWGDWTDEYDNIMDGSNVIAWMPLPEPYKEENK